MNILIVDDHQLFLDGMRLILNKLDAHAHIFEASNAEDAIKLLESEREFDLVLIDLSMPGMDGLSIIQRMHARKTWLPLAVVSAEEDTQLIKSALDMGALGFIPKTHNSQQMLEAIDCILQGDIYIPENIENEINTLESRRPSSEATDNSSLKSSGITKRQYEVLQLLAKGYSNKQIASTLYLTEHTVKAHVSALFTALKVKNRTECAQAAARQGIV